MWNEASYPLNLKRNQFKFVLSLKRNPYEIRLNLRTRDKNIGLARIDNAKYHPNPDGTELRNTPHIHWFKEGYDQLAWAEPIDWYDTTKPIATLERFLNEVYARFRHGMQLWIV